MIGAAELLTFAALLSEPVRYRSYRRGRARYYHKIKPPEPPVRIIKPIYNANTFRERWDPFPFPKGDKL